MGEPVDILHGTFEESGQRLDKALAEGSGLSRERVKALIEEGAVTVAGTRCASHRRSRWRGRNGPSRCRSRPLPKRWHRIFR
jgi:23S rRNA-/tRNA-specific pseudouridylate synthase